MNTLNFDDVFNYPSYAEGKGIDAPFLHLSPLPLQSAITQVPPNHSNSPLPLSSASDAGVQSPIGSDPGEWSKYCAHIDNLLFYGVDSPELPPELLAQPSCPPLPSFLPLSAICAPRPSPLWPFEGGTHIRPDGPPGRSSSQELPGRRDEVSSMVSTEPPTPDTLIGPTTPSTWPTSSPERNLSSRLLSPESSPPLPVASEELSDKRSKRRVSLRCQNSRGPIPGYMLVEFQADTGSGASESPGVSQRGTLEATTRDPRCKCRGPITDWARHWRRSCTGNPGRSFTCSNGCGKRFTRKDNMKRHIDLCECRLYATSS